MKHKTRNVIRAWLLVVAVLISVMSPSVGAMKSKAATPMGVTYAVHIQSFGDSQGWVENGATAGTIGLGRRLEEISIKLTGNEYLGGVRYKTHVQTFGWQGWSTNGDPNGTRGYGRRLEGIEIQLYGDVAKHYDITYRVHCQTYGWMDWKSNGQMAGTSGESKRLEAIEIKLVPKTTVTDMGITYRTHCQSFGWLGWSSNGAESGTTGLGRRLEAIEIQLTGNKYSGGVEYRTHVQSFGWESTMVSNGALSGTSGLARRLEAIEIQLYGEVSNYYDVYYRVHAQTFGWLGWVKNGEPSGTSALSRRLESIQIKLVPKGSDVSAFAGGTGYVDGATLQPVTYTSNDAYMNKVIELCNIQRQIRGIAPLTMHPDLTKGANVRAKEIVTLFDHTRPNGLSCFTAFPNNVGGARGENIAMGQKTPEEVVDDWMNSEGHRKNILNPSYTLIGVGYYHQSGGYRDYWVQNFAGYAR